MRGRGGIGWRWEVGSVSTSSCKHVKISSFGDVNDTLPPRFASRLVGEWEPVERVGPTPDAAPVALRTHYDGESPLHALLGPRSFVYLLVIDPSESGPLDPDFPEKPGWSVDLVPVTEKVLGLVLLSRPVDPGVGEEGVRGWVGKKVQGREETQRGGRET